MSIVLLEVFDKRRDILKLFFVVLVLEIEGTGNWKWDAQGQSEHSAAIFGNLLDDLNRQPKALAERNCK